MQVTPSKFHVFFEPLWIIKILISADLNQVTNEDSELWSCSSHLWLQWPLFGKVHDPNFRKQ